MWHSISFGGCAVWKVHARKELRRACFWIGSFQFVLRLFKSLTFLLVKTVFVFFGCVPCYFRHLEKRVTLAHVVNEYIDFDYGKPLMMVVVVVKIVTLVKHNLLFSRVSAEKRGIYSRKF